jgi:Tol biopolymer transport system component
MRPSCASGDRLVFSQADARSDIWSLPVNLNRGVVTGRPERATRSLRSTYPSPSLTPDGRFLAFVSAQSGQANIRLRDLRAGTEVIVAASPFVQRYPVSNAQGTAIAFSVVVEAVYVARWRAWNGGGASSSRATR